MGQVSKSLERTFSESADAAKRVVSKNDGFDFSSHLIKIQLNFVVKYSIVVGGGSATLKEDDIQNIVNNIKLQSDKLGELVNLSGEDLYKLNWYQTRVKSTATATAANGANTAKLTLDIWFTLQDIKTDMRKMTSLWKNQSAELTLTVTYNPISSVVSVAGGATLTFTSIDLTIIMVEDPDLVGPAPVRFVQSNNITLKGQKDQDELLNAAYTVRNLFFRVEDSSALNSDSELTRLKLRIDNTEYVYNDNYNDVQEDNKRDLPDGKITGFIAKKFDEDGDLIGCRDFSGSKLVQHLFDSVTNGSKVTVIKDMFKA